MIANNEIGIIQPYQQIAKICHEHGIVFHSDGTQGVGYNNSSYSMAFDVLRSGVVCSNTFYAVPNAATVTSGSVIRCEEQGKAWYLDDNLIASNEALVNVTKINMTTKGQMVPCISLKGSVELINFEFQY